MYKSITRSFLKQIQNQSFRNYAEMYIEIYEDFLDSVKRFGLPIEHEEEDSSQMICELLSKNIQSRCNASSLVYQRISDACKACRQATDSYTAYLSLICHKNCYFCFNPNQENYETYSCRKKNWKQELDSLHQHNPNLKYLALTGGEPLLHKEDAIAFFVYAKSLWPHVHTRLYTSGDLLNEKLLHALKDAGLNEIRFSLKLEESPDKLSQMYSIIKLSKEYIPDVLVEMPVMPNSETQMRDVLDHLEELNIFGINLLELCFPFNNADEFNKRGYQIKNPPYSTLYNFWYAGGLPIAGSEKVALNLMKYASEKNYRLSVHYCSLNNKHFGQIYQQNYMFQQGDQTHMFSENDYYLKTIKVFGKDAQDVRRIFKKNNIREYIYHAKHDYLEFHPKHMELLKDQRFEVGICYSIIEIRNKKAVNRELRIDYTTCQSFDINEL